MWLEIEYEPVTLFSLKSSLATSSGAKSLFAPSPFSIKMALFNAIITYDSLETALKNFELIKNLKIQICLPEGFVVNNFMIRILKDNDKVSKEVKKINPFKSTVAFREYIHFNGNIKIAVNTDGLTDEDIEFLKKWFLHINYFGKKGCFFQFKSFFKINELPKGYSNIFKNLIPGILQRMDDMNSVEDFSQINNYKDQRGKKDSIIYIFPYKIEYASKKFYFYKRINV